MIRKILPTTDARLRVKSRPVVKVDKKILKLIQDLKDTLSVQKDPEGIGLAAPQIGKNLRLFVTSYKDFKRVVINPIIVKKSKTFSKPPKPGNEIMEGCLSLPNYYGPLKRSQSVTVEYQNEEAEKKNETFRGFEAQIILHEIDHLNGVLFIDHLLKEKKPLYQLKGGEWEEVELI